ncbi:MAG: deoxynucleoside kinase [Zoogloeaceae bacterium]|nr:deoxynucleoside kinase [Zoogloeaceae bacterium]
MISLARIEICGGIASGKTTLARLLSQGTECELVLEDFHANPFWRRFYERPDLFRHEKDVCFLAQHSGEIKNAAAALTICDYALMQDLAYAELSSDAGHVRVMESLHQHLYAPLPKPTLIVHLQCSESVLLERIRVRGRPEEVPIDVDYLSRLNRGIEKRVASQTAPVLTIRSDEVNFATAGPAAVCVKRQVLDRYAEVR